MTHRMNILFLTNSELGQASVMLAVAAEVAVNSKFSVHLGSFSPLARSAPDSVKFHCIPGQSMKQVLAERGIDFLPMHAPGLRGAVKAYQESLPAVIAPWGPQSYFAIYDYCCELIQELDPAVVVLDPLLGAGFDACVSLGRSRIILSPNTTKDQATTEQPGLSAIWRYPVLAAGYPAPLPYWAIPLNFYLCARMVAQIYSAAPIKELAKARNKRGIPGSLSTSFAEWYPDVAYLVPSTPDTDFPMYIPPNLKGCGPIIPSFEPLYTTHPELAAWLGARPTVVINMGSHVTHAAQQATEMLTAIWVCLEKHPETQVLWKLQSDSLPAVPTSIASRVRIMPWLPSSPVAILTAAPSIVAYVHHGGSNSFHEAVAAGVPQVVCPVWLDTYDFATRVEYFGIGVRGNRAAAPRVKGEELALALEAVVDNAEAEDMRQRASKLSMAVGGADLGREKAADWVLASAEELLKSSLE